MKRLIAAAAAVLLFCAGAASATEVTASIGLELQKQAKVYGESEIETLRGDLINQVRWTLEHAGANVPQRVSLVLEAATPNRPTTNQFSTSRISMSSSGNGGAVVTGAVVGADGVARPISYRWYEPDGGLAPASETWGDANKAFERLAAQLAKGKTPNAGPYRPDMISSPAFAGGSRLH